MYFRVAPACSKVSVVVLTQVLPGSGVPLEPPLLDAAPSVSGFPLDDEVLPLPVESGVDEEQARTASTVANATTREAEWRVGSRIGFSQIYFADCAGATRHA